MEELTPEKLKEILLKNNSSEELYLKYIVDNNIPSELKNKWNMFISNDYLLSDLSRDEINYIMKLFNEVELKTAQLIKNNDEEAIYALKVIRMEFILNLHRSLVIDKPNNDFFSILNLSLENK